MFSENATTVINDGRKHLFAPTTTSQLDSATISMFLAKPRIITTGFWTSQSANSVLFSGSISSFLFASSQWAEKLNGYAYFRGTAVIRLEINAQPFLAGKLLMHFLPQFGARSGNLVFSQKNQTLTSKTQQYSVDIDARDTTATLRIPYISPFSHLSLTNPQSEEDWGDIFVSVLSPLRTGTGVLAADYVVTLHFEDVEVMGPTAQMANNKPAQVLKYERKSMAAKGKVSSTIDALIEPLGYFKNVPFIGEFIGTASEALKGVSGIFNVFGWAKPIFETVAVPFASQYLRFIGNFNGADISNLLSLDATNHLDVLTDVGGTSEDEMSFSYLKKIPALVDTFEWTTSEVADATLYTKPISQQFTTRTNTVGLQNYTLKYGPPYTFVSRYFRYYRGSVNVHIKFAKTQFHAGKILITFDPSVGSNPLVSDGQNALRQIVDLRDASEINLNLPYLRNVSYLPMGTSMGTLSIRVLNPLVCTDTVNVSVQALVYYSAGDDYEVADPVQTSAGTIVAQMNTPEKVVVSSRIGGYPDPDLSLTPVQTCMGELFVSLKQLVMCSRPLVRSTTWNVAIDTPQTAFASIAFWPWSFGIPAAVGGGTPLLSLPSLSGDYLSELATGYAFYRGGLRYTIPSNLESPYVGFTTFDNRNLSVGTNVVAATYPSGDLGIRTISPLTLFPTSVKIATKAWSGNSIACDFHVPYYGPTPFRLTHVNSNNNAIPNTSDVNPDYIGLTTLGGGEAFTQRGLLRAAADDFQFLYFVGFGGYV